MTDAVPAAATRVEGGRRQANPLYAERSRRTHDLMWKAHTVDDPASRAELLDEVILINRGVAEAVANRYRSRGVPLEDLRQAAYEGLVKAVHRFDPSVRSDLLTYAVPTIRGEVRRWFRDRSWIVRPPRRIQELQWHVARTVESLSQELGRNPTDNELIAEVGCSKGQLRDAVQVTGCLRAASLDRSLTTGGELTLADTLASQDPHRSVVEARATLAPAMRRLSARDRRILYLRFFEDRSQREIGVEFDISQTQVSRLLERIMRDLHAQLT